MSCWVCCWGDHKVYLVRTHAAYPTVQLGRGVGGYCSAWAGGITRFRNSCSFIIAVWVQCKYLVEADFWNYFGVDFAMFLGLWIQKCIYRMFGLLYLVINHLLMFKTLCTAVMTIMLKCEIHWFTEQFGDDDDVFGSTVDHTEMKEYESSTTTTPDCYAINSNIR